MFLLIDECCWKGLAAVADAAGHASQRTVEVAELGRGATDAAIFAFASSHRAVVVTVNQGDFIALAGHAVEGAGLILLPALRGTELAKLFRAGLAAATAILEADPAAKVVVAPNGDVHRLEDVKSAAGG